MNPKLMYGIAAAAGLLIFFLFGRRANAQTGGQPLGVSDTQDWNPNSGSPPPGSPNVVLKNHNPPVTVSAKQAYEMWQEKQKLEAIGCGTPEMRLKNPTLCNSKVNSRTLMLDKLASAVDPNVRNSVANARIEADPRHPTVTQIENRTALYPTAIPSYV